MCSLCDGYTEVENSPAQEVIAGLLEENHRLTEKIKLMDKILGLQGATVSRQHTLLDEVCEHEVMAGMGIPFSRSDYALLELMRFVSENGYLDMIEYTDSIKRIRSAEIAGIVIQILTAQREEIGFQRKEICHQRQAILQAAGLLDFAVSSPEDVGGD